MKVIPVSDRQLPNDGSTSPRDDDASSTTSKDDKEAGNQQVSCCSSKRAMYHLFDTTVGNFPMGACMGVVCSSVAFGFVASGAEGCQAMLLKYDGAVSTWYLYALVMCTLVLHCAVFFHGVAVGAVETSRELYHVREIGCYKGRCKDRDTKCGRRCRACQVCGQAGCHVGWAVVGTLLLFVCYAGLVGASIVSSMTTLFSFLFVHACRKYSVLIDDNLQRAYGYLEEAKGHLHRADNVTLQFLNKYNEWMDLQASFRESAMYQLETAAPMTYIEKQPAWEPRSFGRKLYDPRASIASGRSALATLNQTIAHTEAQIAYYDTQLLASVEFCHDYAGLYDAL